MRKALLAMQIAFNLIVAIGAAVILGSILASYMQGRKERVAVRRVAKGIRRQLRGKLNLIGPVPPPMPFTSGESDVSRVLDPVHTQSNTFGS
jgi:hypothetical protein